MLYAVNYDINSFNRGMLAWNKIIGVGFAAEKKKKNLGEGKRK